MTATIKSIISTEDDIRGFAGDTYYQRGLDYYRGGRVEKLLETDNKVKAIVTGTDIYGVTFGMHGRRFDYDCSCPLGEEGEFCKHLVAASLQWLKQQKPATKKTAAKKKTSNTSKSKTPKKPDPIKTIKAHLSNCGKEQLIDLLIEQAIEDPGLHSELLSKALRSQASTDINSQKAFIRNAIEPGGFIHYREMRHYIQSVWSAVDLLQGLIKDGHVSQAAELADYALQLGFAAYVTVDDSAGNLGHILDTIAELHLQACKKAKPDPKQLAQTLFALEQQDDWRIVRFEQYEKLLGKEGLKHFKQLAEKEWQKVPVNKTTDPTKTDYYEYFGITRLMERIADLEGDIDTLVAIKKRSLNVPYRYLEIAEIYADAKRHDDALKWAEDGYKKFKNNQDSRLNEFLIAEYQRRKQHDKAIDIAWRQFTNRPALENYRLLKTCAGKTKTWKQWREKALQWIREDYAKKAKHRKKQNWPLLMQDHTLLVEIFLWEKNIDQALQEAKQGGCAEYLWMNLAHACEKDHPDEALKIYQDVIEGTIKQTNNRAYDEAAAMLKKIKKLMTQLKQQPQFKMYVAELRATYKQKRNFIKRIEKI
jgi:uncharacterized Zn finger protein